MIFKKKSLNYKVKQLQFNRNQTTITHTMTQTDPTKAEQTKKQRKIGYYLLGKTIGQGTFGKVKLATHTLTGEKVAIKILVKEKIIDVADVERVSRQIHILKLIRHPSIIQLYQIIETARHLFLVMEYVEKGELFDYIVDKGKIQEDEACRYFKQLISGVAYLHQLNIVHRDLKPQNLLIDWNKNLKIVDFGLSNTYKPGQMLKTACGSPCYAAPQMIASKKYNGLQVDIWSCGVILFAMVCGYLPFEDSNTSQLYKKILSGQYVLPNFVSQDFKDLLEKILNVNPTKRYRLEQIYEHQWCKRCDSFPLNSGLTVGFHRIPVDTKILQQLKQFDFDKEDAQRYIQTNKHNHMTTAYYLLLKKYLKKGFSSTADISSIQFDYSSVQPFRREETEKKYNFFGKYEDSAIIDIQNKDIKIVKKKQRSQFSIKPITTKNSNKLSIGCGLENRNSNHLLSGMKKQGTTGHMTTTSKRFNDLRMYLKQPKRKQYFSEAKRKNERQERKHNARSVFYEPKENETSQDPLLIRLKTQHSESRQPTRSRSGYRKFRQEKQMKTKFSGPRMNINMIKSINKHLLNNR